MFLVKPENAEILNSGNFRNRDPGFQTLVYRWGICGLKTLREFLCGLNDNLKKVMELCVNDYY